MKIKTTNNIRSQSMLSNTLIITLTSFSLNFCAVYFRLWLAEAMGEEGIGVYQLIISVYSLLATVATSGLSFTVTRTVSETLANKQAGIKRIMRCCFALGICMGLLAFSILFFGADFISARLIKTPETATCLRILACGLPFMSVASCMSGYFIALRKAAFSSAVQITEELSQIAVTVTLFFILKPTDMESYCKLLVIGTAISEFLSAFAGYTVFRFTVGSFKDDKAPFSAKDILCMTLPMSVTGYIKSGLSTLENLTVPISLQKYGMTKSEALSLFGLVKGMVVPVIFFPAILLSAISRLLMPEISEFRAKGDFKEIDRTGSAFIIITYAFSIIVGAVFTFFAKPLCIMIFGNTEAVTTVRVLAPLISFMYIDSIFDSLLKGMGDQMSVMRYSLSEALSRIGLVFLLIPKTGYWGFIFTIYTGNMINTCLGAIRFCRQVRPKFLRPGAIVGLTVTAAIAVFPFSMVGAENYGGHVTVILITASVLTFVLLSFLLAFIRKEDLDTVKRLLLKKRGET